jgi:two-component system KDP operon response regulator KdpE
LTGRRERIAVVDDDPLVVRLLRANLERAGFTVLEAMDGQQGLELVAQESPDLVILDIMLPTLDGYEVCRRIRDFSLAPVLMLTARGEQIDKLRGFEMGADDYLTKPFAPAELLARVTAVLRRSQLGAPAAAAPVIQCGDVSIDLVRRRATKSGEPVALTKTEFGLLQELAQNAGKTLSHTELLTRVWGPEYRDDRDYLFAYVRRLRRKLETDPEHPALIVSEIGYGYRLES